MDVDVLSLVQGEELGDVFDGPSNPLACYFVLELNQLPTKTPYHTFLQSVHNLGVVLFYIPVYELLLSLMEGFNEFLSLIEIIVLEVDKLLLCFDWCLCLGGDELE